MRHCMAAVSRQDTEWLLGYHMRERLGIAVFESSVLY